MVHGPVEEEATALPAKRARMAMATSMAEKKVTVFETSVW